MSDLSRDYVIGDFYPAPPAGQGMGCVPRDYRRHPLATLMGSVSFDKDIALIPRDAWPDLIADQEKNKSRISDIRADIPALDQGQDGYCWAYSTTACVQLAREIANQKRVPLSAHSVAAVIKNFRNEGGWCGLSCEYIVERGIVPQELWPQQAMDRRLNNDANWEAAKEYRITEGFLDLDSAAYDYQLTFDQVATCLLSGLPCVGDFNHWSHSVCLMDLVDAKPSLPVTNIDRWGVRLLNSWGNGWGERGSGILAGRKAVPDGALAVRSVVG